MSTKAKAIEIVSEFGGSVTIAKLRAMMTLEDIPAKVANAAIKEAKEAGDISSQSSGNGFNAYYYSWLVEAERTGDEVQSFINANGTDNSVKHSAHYLRIAELANAIHDSYKVEAAA